jgi:hypothetical protein
MVTGGQIRGKREYRITNDEYRIFVVEKQENKMKKARQSILVVRKETKTCIE